LKLAIKYYIVSLFNFISIIFLELDKYFGEVESSIIQEEIQIMTKLSEFIIQHWISDLHLILKLIAELDWYV